MQVYTRHTRVTTSGASFKGETQVQDQSSLKLLFEEVSNAFEDVSLQVVFVSIRVFRMCSLLKENFFDYNVLLIWSHSLPM